MGTGNSDTVLSQVRQEFQDFSRKFQGGWDFLKGTVLTWYMYKGFLNTKILN